MGFFACVRAPRRTNGVSGSFLSILATAIGLWSVDVAATRAQTIDCGQLRAQIAQSGRGNRAGGAVRRQTAEIARTQGLAHQLGCDGGFSFFGGGDPRCGGLNQRIQQLQAGLSQIQAGGGGGREELVARFNAYCRGGQPQSQPQPQGPRGFFESLFGIGQDEQRPMLPALPPRQQGPGQADGDGDEPTAHRGSQAVCVRACDGGFFPLGISARHDEDDLNQTCEALCPGTQVAVYTRNPDSEISTAMSLDGKPYMDLPNAMKFTKDFTPACSCRPAGKSWAEALANAEEVIGNAHKGDILVTPEKSAEMSRPVLDPKTRTSLLQKPATVSPEEAARIAGDAATADAAKSQTVQVTGPDGLKRTVRRVGPQP